MEKNQILMIYQILKIKINLHLMNIIIIFQ
jgi:hypothetical protein